MKPEGTPFTKWLQRLGVLKDFGTSGVPWSEHIQPVAIVDDLSDVQPPQKIVTCTVYLSRTAAASRYAVHEFTARNTPLLIVASSASSSLNQRASLGTTTKIIAPAAKASA